jgi:VWFA-related protein
MRSVANIVRRLFPARFLAVVLGISITLAAGITMGRSLPQSGTPQSDTAPAGDAPPTSQQAAPPTNLNQRGTIRATVQLVVVPVTVKGPKGDLVAGIGPGEFRVFEDGVEQKISQFSAEATPISAVLLIDDDMFTKPADQVKKSLISMGSGFSAMDEVAVAKFDAFYTPVLDFTTDKDKLSTGLENLTLNSDIPGVGSDAMTSAPTINNHPAPGQEAPTQNATKGLTTKHIDDAIYGAAEMLRGRDPMQRKVIFIVSDGQNARNNTHSYEDTLKLLLASDISVYAVGVDAAVLNRLKSVLARYAHSTGGDVYYATRGGELAEIYTNAAEQARYQYAIGYVPMGTDRAQNYHAIEVRVRRPGLSLLTRDGYYAVAPR